MRHRDTDRDAVLVHDVAAFGALAVRHRRELRGHCLRMLGSTDAADDAVQETLLHAWRWRASFAGRATVRSWLYSIATNVCLDEINRRSRRARARPLLDWSARTADSAGHRPEVAAPAHTEPDSMVLARESLVQACTTVIGVLTPKQRAVLILRDVLRWPAADTATLLGTSVPAVNSALQRARAALQTVRTASGEIRSHGGTIDADRRVLLRRYVDVLERSDAAATIELVRTDIAAVRPHAFAGA